MVVFNQELEYLNFGYKDVPAKSGREIAAVMYKLMAEHEGLVENVECFITDRCPAQELANSLVTESINSNRPEDKKVFSSPCLMHTTLNLDNRSEKQLSDDTRRFSKGLQIWC